MIATGISFPVYALMLSIIILTNRVETTLNKNKDIQL
ncbi:hypothetical protein XIS1_1790018 [Xenorhabdus innexi]|uniref:Uncharacterized protein n=1 Tax=Xenorhabdus innexi TaxID=290109 RepID=A0A1N6MWM9_9GAMM|nr:hypothetical protein Xinn_01982 [Xenorhabdus innexi]SIP73212.1 hypothetical protein XIS1_1790018 [Xenorhabdus innexi]